MVQTETSPYLNAIKRKYDIICVLSLVEVFHLLWHLASKHIILHQITAKTFGQLFFFLLWFGPLRHTISFVSISLRLLRVYLQVQSLFSLFGFAMVQTPKICKYKNQRNTRTLARTAHEKAILSFSNSIQLTRLCLPIVYFFLPIFMHLLVVVVIVYLYFSTEPNCIFWLPKITINLLCYPFHKLCCVCLCFGCYFT